MKPNNLFEKTNHLSIITNNVNKLSIKNEDNKNILLEKNNGDSISNNQRNEKSGKTKRSHNTTQSIFNTTNKKFYNNDSKDNTDRISGHVVKKIFDKSLAGGLNETDRKNSKSNAKKDRYHEISGTTRRKNLGIEF